MRKPTSLPWLPHLILLLVFGAGYALLWALHPYTSLIVDLETVVFYVLLTWVVTWFAQPVEK